MKKELDDKLCAKYPQLFADRYGDMRQTAMCWGFECGDGWYEIIDELCEKIMATNPHKDTKVLQVKEKFGTLRFYTTFSTDEIDVLIDEAEEKSAQTCEVCGKAGILRKGGWLSTRCDTHN